MECGDYDRRWSSMARGPGAVGLQLNFCGERGLPLAFAPRVHRKPARPVILEPPHDAREAGHILPTDVPFMNEMDEISYWIHTKRAPCLMNYDNLLKKQSEEAQGSKAINVVLPSPRKKKKKRKLSMLDDESVSTVKKQNVYFEVPQKHNLPLLDRCKSDSLGSDLDFNIKNTTGGEKPKRARLQKSNRAKIHKKIKVVTSTPKTANLRRSLRQAQQSNNNVHLNSSFEIFNSIISNGHVKNNINSNQKPMDKMNKSTQMFDAGDQADNKRNISQRNKCKNTTQTNGQYEDSSDVSGFTANYIRSTKVQSSKTPRKLRCKSSRNLVKEPQHSSQNDKMVVCVNKSVNTGLPKTYVHNCNSTDSSQNVINLITLKNNDKSAKVDKSTSLLKFVDTRSKSKEGASNKIEGKQKSKSNLNVSFQSQSSGTSRYPKRCRNHNDMNTNNADVSTRRRGNTNCIEFNNSDKKENPEETVISRTRSGRNIALSVHQRENSVLVISNSTEQVSSMVSMNVASPTLAEPRKKRRTTRQVHSKKSVNKSGQSFRRDSLRDKSGFAACFSESDDDSVPLMHRKYFCNN